MTRFAAWRVRRRRAREERDRLSGWNPRRGVYEKGGIRVRGRRSHDTDESGYMP